MLKSMINPDLSGKTRLTKGIILFLGLSLFFSSLIFAGPNENAGIVFDLNATTYGNQNLTGIPSQPADTYIRVDVYCTGVQNLDTYEFEVIYDPTELSYVAASAANLITFEPNILTTNGGEAIGWMVDSSTPGVLSIAYTLAGTDTLEAPEGEGLIADIVFLSLVATHGTLSFGDVHFYDSFGVMDIITDKGIAILYEFGNIDGTVTDANNGEPIEGAIVSISDFSDTTGTDGTYLLEYVPIGIHDITCTFEGYYDTVDVVEVLEDQTVTVDFVLETLPRGTLDGTVTDANNGEPIEDALITATSQGKVEYTGFTNADGYYIIDSLLASEIVGSYIVTCEAGVPYTSGEVTDVEIIEDETTTIDFALAAPIMVVSPLEIFPVVENMGDSTIIDITVSNIGTAPFDWDTDIENPDAITLDFTTNRFEGVTAPSMNAEVDPNQTTPYNPPTKDIWDLLFSYDLETPTGSVGIAGAGFGNGYFLVSEFGSSRNVFKFDVDGNYISSWIPTWMPGTAGLRDMAFDGTYFYGSNAGNTIYSFDEDGNLYGTINSPVAVRSIAYDEVNDAFWVNNWSEDLKLVDRSGNVLNTISSPPSMYGSAYDNSSAYGPYLWIFTGTSSGGGCQIEQYDLNTLDLTGVTHSVSGDFPGTTAGGLFTSGDIVPGTWVLGGLAQAAPDILFGYELYEWIIVEPTSGTIEPGGDEIVQATVYWVDEFFPGQVKYADIVFTPAPNCGEQTVNVTATFGPDIPGSISGLVTLENTPYSSGNVEDVLLTAVNQVFPSSYYTAYPDSTGEYTIQGVYPGTYDVTASLLYDYEDSTIVDVEVEEATNTPNIDFELNCLLGALQGTVTDGYGEPIEGATITALGDLPPSEPYCDTTNEDGYYEIDPIIGQFYNFTCEAEGFLTFTDTLTVLPGETYVEDVIMGNPEIRVEPDSYEVTLAPETQTTRLITVYNDGNAPLSWSVDIQFPDRQVINIPPATTDFPRSEDKLSLSLAPKNGEPINSSTTPMINPLGGTTAYAFNVSPGSDLVTFDTDAPETWLTTIPMTYSPFAADFAIDDNFYAVDYWDNNLYAVDIETGVFTLIGPTQASTDLACDKTDGTMYASYYESGNSYLCTIDLTTGSATLIGLINAGGIIISMACDCEGNLWGFDIADDALYAIDKDDGHGTYVGSVGFDGSYAQSMAWNPESDIVYMAAYNNTVGAGQLRIVDTSTGATALVGTFNDGAEVTGLGFQGGVWINIYPTSGYVLPGEYEEVTATFKSLDFPVGTVKTANIRFIPNVGQEDSVFAELIVGSPITGTLDGYVKKASDLTPIEGAVVTATSVGDVKYQDQDTTNSDGYYIIPEIWEDTYNVNCFAAGYNIPATQTAVIVEDETTTVNFNLTQPTMDITPTSISETVSPSTPIEADIHIVNNGDGELAWDASIELNRGVETDYSNCTTGILEAKNGQANGGNGSNGFVAEENFKDDVTLHYDGPHYDAIGLTSGGTFMVAARFTPTELGDYYGNHQLSNVEIFIYDMPTSATLKVWEGGSMGDPGTEIYSEDITGQISTGSWNSIILSAPIDLVSDNEYWVGYEVTYNAGLCPAGCDAGPAVDEKGDWVYLAPGPWKELQNLGLDMNWNIRAVLSPGINWIILTHNSGIVEAGGDSIVTVYFNTIDHTIGDTLHATIDFVSTPDVGTTSIPVTITVGDIGVTGEPEILVTELYGNFPNPFGSSTIIKFSLKEATYVKLSVYNIRGQLVNRLIDKNMVAGADYQVKWDGASNDKKLANGIYFYKLDSGNKTFLKKMILMR